MGQALSFGQLALALLELLLGPLAILNVDRCSVPLNEVSLLVAQATGQCGPVITSFFRVGRHLYRASGYREVMKTRFAVWEEVICVEAIVN